jgi:hypothetical protein
MHATTTAPVAPAKTAHQPAYLLLSPRIHLFDLCFLVQKYGFIVSLLAYFFIMDDFLVFENCFKKGVK